MTEPVPSLPSSVACPPVEPLTQPRSIGEALDALLKRPDAVWQTLTSPGRLALAVRYAGVALLGMAAYGLAVGCFPGGMQLAAVPLKLAGGLAIAAVICWPSLYVLLSLAGSRQSAAETAGLLTATVALIVVLMAGFAPVAWIFAQSTRAAAFMGALHLALWGISCVFSLRRLGEGLRALNGRRFGALPLWAGIFLLVCLQMSAALRPLLGPFKGWGFAPRAFFLQVWFSS